MSVSIPSSYATTPPTYLCIYLSAYPPTYLPTNILRLGSFRSIRKKISNSRYFSEEAFLKIVPIRRLANLFARENAKNFPFFILWNLVVWLRFFRMKFHQLYSRWEKSDETNRPAMVTHCPPHMADRCQIALGPLDYRSGSYKFYPGLSLKNLS